MKRKDSWNLQLLYEGDDDPKIQSDAVNAEEKVKAFVKKWKDRRDYLEKPEILAQALDEYEKWNAKYGLAGNAGYYWWLRSKQNQDDTKIKAEINKLHEQEVRLDNELTFFLLRIGKIDEELQPKFLDHPELRKYRHFLDFLFKTAKYQLSEDEEKIMNLTEKTSYSNWVEMVDRFLSREERIVLDEDGKKRKKNFSEIQSLMLSPKKTVRDSSAEAMEKICSKHADVAETEMNSICEAKKFGDGLRGYKRPDEARHIGSDIDTKVVDAMISAVSSDNKTSGRFYRLKSKLLGLPQLSYHDRAAPYGKTAKKYDFDTGYDLVHDVFGHLDSEFSEILEGFREEGRFDIYPKKGKSGGAFCVNFLITSPVYILFNYSGKTHDVLTIAHEVGHGINSELMKKSQNSLNFGSPLSIAEVASTFFEDFVLERLLEKADGEERLVLLVEKMDDDMSAVYRQVAAYRFEQELHNSFRKKGYLSKDDIGEIFIKHMKEYLGGSVKMDYGAEYGWVHWGHFRTFFYVYSYASGVLISKALQRMVRADPDSISKVKKIFSAGSSKAPAELFKSVGIDITDEGFWKQGLAETERLLEETEELARKLDKI